MCAPPVQPCSELTLTAAGEQCEYKTYSPQQWLAEVSGVPFGLPGEILGDNSDQWQGLVHGMTCRIYPDPWRCNPRPIWSALDALGMHHPLLLGWWSDACPVSVATSTVVYSKEGGSGPAVVASVFVGGTHSERPRFAVVRPLFSNYLRTPPSCTSLRSSSCALVVAHLLYTPTYRMHI